MLNVGGKSFNNLISVSILPIVAVATFLGYFLLSNANKRESEFLLDKSELLAKLIGNVQKFETQTDEQLEHQKLYFASVINQIQNTFLSYSPPEGMEYLLAKKENDKIVFIAYTSKQPPSISWTDNTKAIPMRKALNHEKGIIVANNYLGEKVFAAYQPIPNSDLGLVVFRKYSAHIKPYVIAISILSIFILVLIIFLYFLLKKNEKSHQIRLINTERRFQQLVENTSDWVCEVDLNAVFTYSNNQVEKLLGYKAEEIIGKTPYDVMEKDEANRVATMFEQLILNKGSLVCYENINIHKDGHKIYMYTSASPFFDENGNVLGFRGTNRDMSQLKLQQLEVEHLAYYDTLTSLSNRAYSLGKIKEELDYCQRNSIKSALLFIDLDNFKIINDSQGHDHGDEVLKTVSSRIKNEIRSFDMAGRFGGDEFIVTIRGNPNIINECVKHLNQILSRLLLSIAQPIEFKNKVHSVSLSIGVCIMPDDGHNVDELIKNADTAMYKAKKSGKNKFMYFNNELNK